MRDIALPIFENVRLEPPEFLLAKLKVHPLTRCLYPIAMGHRIYTGVSGKVDERQLNGYVLIYCTGGKGEIFCSGDYHQIRAGDLMLIPPREIFCKFASKKDSWSLYWVNFDGDLASSFVHRLEMKMNDKVANVAVQPKVITDFETLLELKDRGYTATNVIHAVHLLQQLLSYLALQLRMRQLPDKQEFDLEMIEALMMQHLRTNLTLDTIAEYANLSKYYFSKRFKKLTGRSPIEYFIKLKMQHACYLLKNESSSIKQVAAYLGYTDPYYFSRIFKKAAGVSPNRYRTKSMALTSK